MKQPCVYILASQKNGTLYIGVTSDIHHRLLEHRTRLTPGFASKYKTFRLVWFEYHDCMDTAIQREKSLKRYPRQWKINLIEERNPDCRNLNPDSGEFIPNP